MNARDKFGYLQEVELSAEGAVHFRMSRSIRPGARGVVIGFSTQPDCVVIRRHGLKTPQTFHMRFWRTLQLELPLTGKSAPSAMNNSRGEVQDQEDARAQGPSPSHADE